VASSLFVKDHNFSALERTSNFTICSLLRQAENGLTGERAAIYDREKGSKN